MIPSNPFVGHKCQLARDKNDHFHLVDPRLDLKIERTTRLLPPMDSIKIYKNTHTFSFLTNRNTSIWARWRQNTLCSLNDVGTVTLNCARLKYDRLTWARCIFHHSISSISFNFHFLFIYFLYFILFFLYFFFFKMSRMEYWTYYRSKNLLTSASCTLNFSTSVKA